MKKHPVHRYQRAKLGSVIVWRCILGGCTHYVNNEFITGLFSLCKCGRTFTMDKDKQRRKTPKCDLCQQGRSSPDEQQEVPKSVQDINIDDLLEGLE